MMMWNVWKFHCWFYAWNTATFFASIEILCVQLFSLTVRCFLLVLWLLSRFCLKLVFNHFIAQSLQRDVLIRSTWFFSVFIRLNRLPPHQKKNRRKRKTRRRMSFLIKESKSCVFQWYSIQFHFVWDCIHII